MAYQRSSAYNAIRWQPALATLMATLGMYGVTAAGGAGQPSLYQRQPSGCISAWRAGSAAGIRTMACGKIINEQNQLRKKTLAAKGNIASRPNLGASKAS